MDFVMPTLSSKNNKLYIGKNDICELADKYGTPLYVMDEDYIRNVCREFQTAMKEHYGDNALISFASKAFCATYMYKILEQEKFGADVVSGGELYTLYKVYPLNFYCLLKNLQSGYFPPRRKITL